MVYLSDSAAAAMLEVLVHLEIDPEDVPDNFRLLRVEIPDDVPIGEPPGLPETWEDRPEYTRSFGDSWLEGNDSLLLPVPSAIMPHTQNYLFNPIHRDAGRAVLTVESLRLDRRLIRAK